MGIKCGIVGLPNVGKSTIFNAITKSQDALVGNYPFCTIDANTGIVPINDPRLNELVNIFNSRKSISNTLEIVDIAGLVKGASNNEGLGNKFLGNIREVDMILHMVRCFENDDIQHVNNIIDPVSDIQIINTELVLADLEKLNKAIEKHNKTKTSNKNYQKEAALMQVILKHLEEGNMVNSLDITDEEDLEFIKKLQFLTSKKMCYIANVDEDSFASKGNKFVDSIKEKLQIDPIVICAQLEYDLISFSEEEKNEVFSAYNITQSGLTDIVQRAFYSLELITFITAGETEVRGWTTKKGSTAKQAAGVIHTDFEKGFIKAEVCKFADMQEYKSYSALRDVGKLHMEGKEYIVCDGDIMHFKFNV